MARNLEIAKLFYRLELESRGFDQEIDKAGKKFESLAGFVAKHPVAALGALGTALIGVGVTATNMAAEVDAAMRRVAVAVPGAVERLDELKEAGADLAKEFGISQTEIAKIMEMVARTGVESADDLIAASRAAVRAQRATGEEFGSIIGLIDAAMDNFGVSADQADSQLAKLIATAKGKVSLADLEEVLRAIGPTAKAAGVSFDTMVSAIVTVRPTAKDAKDTIAELNSVIDTAGRGGLERLADQSRIAGDGIKEMSDQIKAANGTIENQSAILREQLNAQMTQFGDVVLPHVIKALGFFVELMGDATVKMHRFQEKVAETTGTEAQAEAVRELGGALRELVGDGKTLDRVLGNVGTAFQDNFEAINRVLGDTNKIQDLTKTKLKDLEAGLTTAAGSGKLTVTQMKAVAEALSKINAEQLRRDPIITQKDTEGLDGAVTRLERIKELAASGAGLDAIKKALGDLSRAETEAATKAIANHKKATAAAGTRVKAEQAVTKIILAGLEQVSAKMADVSNRLGEQGDKIRENAKTAKEGQEKVLQGEDEILDLQDAINRAVKKHVEFLEDAAKVDDKRIEKAQRLISAFGGLAQGLLGALQAAGLFDDKMVATLGHVINIAEQIEAIQFSEKSLFDPANLASLAGVVGSLIGVLDSIFSGGGAEEKARKKLIQENNDVLAELVAVNGDLLRINQPGFKLAGVEQALGAVLSDPRVTGSAIPGLQAETILRPLLVSMGLSIKDLENIASDLGFDNLRTSSGGLNFDVLKQILATLQNIDVGFATDFQGMLDKVQTFLEAGIIAPEQEFASLLDVGKQLSPAIAKALEGIDPFGRGEVDPALIQRRDQLLAEEKAQRPIDEILDDISKANFEIETEKAKGGLADLNKIQDIRDQIAGFQAEIARIGELPGEIADVLAQITQQEQEIGEGGRASAIDAFQQLLLDFASGKLDKAALGGLTGQEFIDFITRMIGILESPDFLAPVDPVVGADDPLAGEETDPATTDYQNESLGAADEQADLLSQGLSLDEQQVQHLAAIETLLAGIASFQPSEPGLRAIDALLSTLGGAPVVPPSLPGSILNPEATQRGGIGVSVGDIAISVNAAPGMDESALATLVAEQLSATLIDRTLGDRFLLAQSRRGIIT